MATDKQRFDILDFEKSKLQPFSFENKLSFRRLLMKNKLDKAPFSFLPQKAKEDLLSHFSSFL
jgi:hypothetical protein